MTAILPARRNAQTVLACFGCLLVALIAALDAAGAQTPLPSGGRSVLRADALLTTPVGGLERTQSTAGVIPISGAPVSQGLRITVRTSAPETNATQLTMPIAEPVSQGDVLLVSFFLRGAATAGTPAHVE